MKNRSRAPDRAMQAVDGNIAKRRQAGDCAAGGAPLNGCEGGLEEARGYREWQPTICAGQQASRAVNRIVDFRNNEYGHAGPTGSNFRGYVKDISCKRVTVYRQNGRRAEGREVAT